ncbi:MAG: neutral/alkaline non-lysosomal ceramidase N-terminal domain-containing protein, partial [Acidobacteria bacterium]|nr:neutral/alkaline non-lysosomal ceramidase N-terminal domain-containing protein [Acidobacteriota bacterium]
MNRNRHPALRRNRLWRFRHGSPRLFLALAATGCAAMAFLAGCASAGRVDTKLFRAGAYAIDVTPEKFPISVNGSGPRQATGAHDPLYARSLVLDDGTVRIALAVVDSCMLPRDLLDEAKALAARATGISPDRMLVSATHTHSAPTVAAIFQSEPDEAYRKYLIRRIAEGITKANDRLAPAQIGWAVGQVPNQVFNRRWLLKPGKVRVDPFGRKRDLVQMNPGHNNPDVDRPAGPTDPELPILAVRSPAGRPIAALVNYSLHYVGGVPRLLVSGDYFGAFARRFTEIAGAGPEFVAIMSNGTSGDINNNDYSQKAPRKRQPGEQIARVADDVARAAWE